MNWARDTVESADPARLALLERTRDGARLTTIMRDHVRHKAIVIGRRSQKSVALSGLQ